MKKLVLLVFTLLYFSFIQLGLISILASVSYAQSNPEDIINKFFDLYKNKGSDMAVDYVFSTNKWMDKNQDVVIEMKMRLKKAINIIGNYYGYELITKKSLGQSYLLYSYVVKYERQPIQFTFILYKPDKSWQIQNLRFDDNLTEELEEADDD